jgi:hypothetical protein
MAWVVASTEPVASVVNVMARFRRSWGFTRAFYFTHFWGKGKAADLAGSLRAVLDVQAGAGREKGD